MARVASSESVRFTPAQRDALISVAARLQAEHEATVGAEELALAAREAGIDPRFLGEAAAELNLVPTRTETEWKSPIVGLAGLAAVDLIFLFDHPGWSSGIALSPLKALLLVGATFVLAGPIVSVRRQRWAAPFAVLAVWLLVGGGFALWSAFHRFYGNGWLPSTLVAVGAIQALSALTASGLAAYREGGNR